MPRQNRGFLDVLKRPNYRKPNKFDINRPKNDAFFSNFSNSTLRVIHVQVSSCSILKWGASTWTYGGTKSRIQIAFCLNLTESFIARKIYINKTLHIYIYMYQKYSHTIHIDRGKILFPTSHESKNCFQVPAIPQGPPTFACAVLSSKFLQETPRTRHDDRRSDVVT